MKSTIKKLPLSSLYIHPTAQRIEGVDQSRVAQMAANFRPELLGVLVGSEQSDGRVALVDGAHRFTLSQMVGHTAPVSVEVFTGLDLAGEAALFLGRNAAKMPSALSKFHARVLMDDAVAVDVATIAERHGWKIAFNSDPGHIAAIHALERVYRNAGGVAPEGTYPDLTDRVLEIITAAWERDSKSADGSILLAVAQLVHRFGASIDTKKLVEEMQGTRPAILIGKAKVLRDVQGGTIPAALAKILAGMHNNRRRTNLLPEWVWIR
jgi:hypothetical protein